MPVLAQIQDALHLAKSFTPGRIRNAVKIYSSYFSSKRSKENKHKGMPVAISIEPTTSCNLRCPECPSGLRAFTRPTGMLQTDLNKKVIDELKNELTYITYYFQGEPYLNKDFTEMVKYASDHNIYTATSTNAHYLNDENCKQTVESGLKKLIISIDGIDQDSYAKYRIGGKLDKVLEGTRNMVRWKKEMKSKSPFIVWQFIVFSHNEDQIPEIKKLAKEVGVDKLAIKTAQLYDFETGSERLPSNDKYRRYKEENGKYNIKNKLLNHCWRMWHSCVITWDGKVAPCCFDKDASYRLGDLQTHSFKEIWGNSEYSRFRRLILKSRSNIDICQNCSEGTKIWS
ncbi:radical SAM protein [bacterium]|nr:radical SAM protein [bacterium]